MNYFDIITCYMKKIGDFESYILFSIYVSDLEKNNDDIKDTLLNYFPNRENEELINGTLWLGKYKWLNFGIYQNKIIAFGEDGHFFPFCDSVQDIPLEILNKYSILIEYDKNKKNNIDNLNELIFFSNDNNYFQILENYIDFTKLNNIPLNSKYFDKDGELKVLQQSFEIDYDYADFGIEHLKDKIFIN